MRGVSSVVRLVVAVIGVLTFAAAVAVFPYALRAARGEGIHGSFTAERQDCSRHGCAAHGTWRADPPSEQAVTDAVMDEWPEDQPVGESVEALYLGETDPASVYPAHASFAWLYILVCAGGAVLGIYGSRAAIKELRADRRAKLQREGYEPRRVKNEHEY